uniref:UPF3 domain-containing protein n=1 Tax=Graphocephala atropunctata TaxID=36148 RepID=A0A1B6MEL1_9HEMI
MKEEKTTLKGSAGKENEPVLENGKKKGKEEKPATKVVVRRLPPSMTEEQFKNQVSPLPEIDYFYFVPADMSLMPNAFCRAYINFVDQSDLFIFTQKFDGYVFVDSKGNEFPAIVEFAPFQRIPKNRPNRKKDPKVGTIEADPGFIAFKERLEAEMLENKTAVNASKQHFFETSLIPEKKEAVNTPLLDFVKHRRAEKQKVREEKREEKRKRDLDRKKAKEEQRRIKKEEDTSVVKTSSTSTSSVNPKPKTPVQSIPSSSIKPSLKNDKVEGKECTSQEIEKQQKPLSVITDTEEPQVTMKVREMVNFFNKSIKENNCTNLEINSNKHISAQTCVEHKAVESEIIRSASGVRSTSSENLKYFSPTKCKKIDSPYFNESNNIAPCYNAIPILTSRGKVFVPRSSVKRAQTVSDLVLKPVRIDSSVCQKPQRENNVNIEKVKLSSSKTFSSDIFRKNLQKVVEDVLGNANVKCPKENEINKPKTFIKRVFGGSGEQCARAGYNSPGFYLPPRAFGCGLGEVTNTHVKHYGDSKQDGQCPRPLQSAPACKGNFHIFSRKPLPPFSKNSIFFSKSDGDIEKTESILKVGGSQEILKRKIDPWMIEGKPHLLRRPFVSPKKCLVVENRN